MKEELLGIISRIEGQNLKINTIREYLQAFILRILYKNEFFQHAIFHGGTCLRFIHNTKRFSEDLDFALLKFNKKWNFNKLAQTLKVELTDSGYNTYFKAKEKGAVHSVMINFPEILYETHLSNRKNESVSIKIDLDTRPPSGAQTENHLINRHFLFGLTSYDIPTLYAGKVNAILTRSYLKGRDFYDLFWFLVTHKQTSPNFGFLKNALLQFKWREELLYRDNWKKKLIQKLKQIDWDVVQKEVELLIEDRDELIPFTRENLFLLLKQ